MQSKAVKRPGDETQWSKEARNTDCRPPKKAATSQSRAISLANDLLDSAYRAKRHWTGEKDQAANSWERHSAEKENAQTWEQWRDAAEKLDILEGNFAFKLEEETDECDMALIRTRLNRLKRANHEGDIEEMLLQIRHGLKRDLGGMCNPHLYGHAHIGTKHLIEEYTEVVRYTIDKIIKHCETADEQEVDRCLEMMKAARKSFGNTALMLSGGGTLGMCHIGVVKALLETGVLPKVVCGSSAGSIVGSVLCTQKPSVIGQKLDELITGDLRVFQGVDEWQGIPGMAINLLKGDPAFNISNLCRVMQALLGNITFREAYNLSNTVLNIHVSCRDKHNLPRLLNYLTAPNVVVWSAVASSCALPCVFEAPGLRAKNPITGEIENWGHDDHKWIDGSIEGDLPAQILERMFNVNNFIASQVNPHVIQFIPREGEAPSMLRRMLSATRANAIYMLDTVMEQGFDPFVVKMVRAVLSQKYDGDITILPNIDWVPYVKILANPTNEFMIKATQEGEKATWPMLDRIHKSVAIELALDNAVNTIRGMGIPKPRRVPSSTRSDRGLYHWRSTSSGALHVGKLTIGPRFNRNTRPGDLKRSSTSTMPDFSMSLTIPQMTTTTTTTTNNQQSSSDETSGGSSPTTEYDDEGCQADEEPSENDFDDAEDHRLRMLSFRSQPASPSLSMKSYWGSEAHKSPPPPAASGSLDMRIALKGLQMSSLDDSSPPGAAEHQ